MDKGLKTNAIGYLSNIVIGVASTAPAYSLAATLGFIVAVTGVGVHAPAVLLVSFIPMLLVAAAYKYLNRADPDAGTTFAWTTRALRPGDGWINGWAIFLADVIVMASLSDIAAIYTFKLFGFTELGESKAAIIVAAIIWIVLMTWICYRGIELSARIQQVLLGAEIAILGAVRGRRVRQGLRQPSPGRLDQAGARLVQPVRDELRAIWSSRCCSRSSSTGAGIPAWRSTRSPRTRPRARARPRSSRRSCSSLIYVIVTAAAQSFHGTGFLTNEENQADILNALGNGVLGSDARQAADHRRAHLRLGLDADDDPADRPHDAVDGPLESGHRAARARAQALSDADRLDARLRRALDHHHGRRCCCSPKACSKTRSRRSAFRSASTTASPASPAAFYYRRELLKSARNFLLLGLGPLIGGLMLFGIGIKAAFYYGKPENVSSKPILGITLPLWMGIGGMFLGVVIMIVSRPFFKEFFSRKPKRRRPGLIEKPPSTHRAGAYF